MGSVGYAPDQTVTRTVKTDDVALPTVKAGGANLADFDEVVMDVVLKNAATLAIVRVYFWNAEAAAFIPEESIQQIVAAGSKRKLVRVYRADSVFFEVTGIAGGVGTDDRVSVVLSGCPAFHEVG